VDSGLVLFRLLILTLQPGAVGPYPVWGAWFPSRLPLEETTSYPNFFVP
jgi:hypothetical protein